MLGRLTIRVGNSWLGYKRSKVMTHAMEALYKNNKFFHSRLKVMENKTAAIAKTAFNYLQALKTRIKNKIMT